MINFSNNKNKKSLKTLLQRVIPAELLKFTPTSYEIIGSRSGSVIIIQIPEELKDYEKEIVKALISLHKNVKSIIKKVSERKGEYRLFDYYLLYGNSTEIIHKEYGYYIKVDPLRVYFSAKDATDRIDIAKSVNANEDILYMFAGVAPYAVAICKYQPNVKKIVAIEKNEIAYKYMLETIKLNKLEEKVIPILGDVREVCPQYYNFADRILMTLPLGAHEYLPLALYCIKKTGGIIHFYHIGKENMLYDEAIEIIAKYCKQNNFSFSILKTKVVNEYAPYKYKVRVDFYTKKI
jgi:tRNA (guanine37-N1)-methyltransferase